MTPGSQIPQQLRYHLLEQPAVIVISGLPRHMGEVGGTRRGDLEFPLIQACGTCVDKPETSLW